MTTIVENVNCQASKNVHKKAHQISPQFRLSQKTFEIFIHKILYADENILEKNQYSVFRSIVFPLSSVSHIHTHSRTPANSRNIYTFRIRTEMFSFFFRVKI
jgi:hypothetical protein